MKYLMQFGVILGVSFVGEVMKYLIPLSIPASIYGLVLMLVLLSTGVIKLEMIEDTADFLIKIMPLMFIPAVVGLIESYSLITGMIIRLALFTVVTTVIVMAVCGRVTQFLMNRGSKSE